jgi:short-subunit dehydrogenase
MNILITGGSKGIGNALVNYLSKNNTHRIFFTYFRTKPNVLNPNCEALKVDFVNEQDMELLITKLDEFNIDVLINNYHTGYNQVHAHKLNISELYGGLASNVFPTIYLTNQLITRFRKKKAGTVVTILTASLNDFPTGCVQYIAEKRYLSAFVDAWQKENIAFGVNSVAIYPEFINTDIHKNLPDFVKNSIEESNAMQDVIEKLTEVLNVI